MFSWGEDWQQGFRLKKASTSPTADGLRSLNLSFHIKDLSAGRSLLAFVKSGGDPFIIRTVPSEAGGSVRSKQKFVKCNEKIEAVSCGDDAVALLSESGKLLCVDTTRIPFTPSTPEALSNIPVSHIACGDHHTVVLTKDGQLYTWGQNSKGQLGLGTGESSVNSPQHVRSLSAIPLVQVAAGGEQSFALSVSGGVFSWGGNHHGQLGLGDTQDRHSPTLVNNLNMKKTVSISCGKDHTAILTKDGVVFTFGSGQYGQLGHNSLQDELRPRLVAELWGSKVTKIACGSYHTLVLTDSKKVYSFGCNDQGQLGRGEKSHPSVPLPVQLPHDTNNFYAGGNSSFSTCTSNEDVNNGSNGVTQRCIENMIDKWISECDFKSQKTLKQEIHQMFNSSFCMNQSFLDRSKDKHFQTSPKYSGLDLSLAQHSFNKLVKSNVAYEEVEAGVLEMLPCLDRKPVSVEGLRIFMLLSELLRASQKHKLKQSMRLADAIAATLQTLSDESLQILGDWWSSLSPSSMVRHVQVWKEALSQILSSNPVSHNSEARNILLILQYMYNANKRNKKIPETAFSFQINQTFLAGDLQRWRTRDVAQLPLILHTFQFVMDLKSKKMAFDMNAQWTQNEHQGPPQMDFIFPYGWVPRLEPSFFELRLQRASLLEGTFRQLAAAPPSTFKKPLMVYLDGDPKRTDVYKRDVFHHLFHKIVRAKPEMFMLNESKTLAWFPSNATEEDERNFFLLGFLCGLALYNKSIIHLPFPLVLFKKLLNVEATLEDMMEFSPLTARVLQNILNYDDEVLDDLYLDFSITWDGTEVDLDPQNPGKPLTSQNKKEYVEAYINHAFNTSVEGVFKEFRRGFFQVCNQDLVKLFRPDELQGVLVGQDIYDWKKFKLNTVYEWGLHNHFIMKWFWEVFDELTEEQKKDFFRFLTGYRRVPILGMGQIQMKVRVKQIESSSYDQHLPESLTCHSILELPLYSTKAIMRDRLTEALTADTGFTL